MTRNHTSRTKRVLPCQREKPPLFGDTCEIPIRPTISHARSPFTRAKASYKYQRRMKKRVRFAAKRKGEEEGRSSRADTSGRTRIYGSPRPCRFASATVSSLATSTTLLRCSSAGAPKSRTCSRSSAPHPSPSSPSGAPAFPSRRRRSGGVYSAEAPRAPAMMARRGASSTRSSWPGRSWSWCGWRCRFGIWRTRTSWIIWMCAWISLMRVGRKGVLFWCIASQAFRGGDSSISISRVCFDSILFFNINL